MKIFTIGKYACYICFIVSVMMIFITGKLIFGIGALMFALLLVFCYNERNIDTRSKDE